MRLGSWAIRTGLICGLACAAVAGAVLMPAGEPAPASATASVAAPATPPMAPQPVAASVAAAPATPAEPAATAPYPATADMLVVKRILDIPGPIRFGEYYWDTDGIPADGPLIITVDLEAETMSVFRDGYEIGATAILYGADEKPTPLGVYPITQKKVHHISNLYHVPMPYMMRLTNDGIAIHASDVEMGAATHGCIGVPLPFAKLLFAQAKLGDRVIVTRGKRLGMGGVIAGS